MSEIDIVDIWVGLKYSQSFWSVNSDPVNILELECVDTSDLCLMQSLRDVTGERWVKIGQAAGWSSIHATALSWCSNVSACDAFRVWNYVPEVDFLSARDRRAAYFFNPEHLRAEEPMNSDLESKISQLCKEFNSRNNFDGR